jgi:hypothetical protein
MMTLDLDTLSLVTGGNDTEQANLAQLEACKQWAASSHEGRDSKLALCDKEFVSRNWGSFTPSPTPRRVPL